jgi:hypothetical protein
MTSDPLSQLRRQVSAKLTDLEQILKPAFEK